MKKITFALVALMAVSTSLMAQMKEGKITYERKTNMHRFITDPEMKARIPEFRTDNFELLFNEQSSLFRNAPEDEAPDPFAGNGGGGGTFRFRMPESTTYIDFPSQLLYESRGLFEKNFLIVDTVKPMKWKISDETKTILKHVCKKATTTVTQQAMGMNIRIGGPGRRNTDSTQSKPATPKEVELAVWYAEDIPVSIGPDTYNGLPGAILEVDMDNGANVTRATEITAKYPKKELVQPTKGDKMSRAQYQEEMKKLMQNMQQGGGMRFRMNN